MLAPKAVGIKTVLAPKAVEAKTVLAPKAVGTKTVLAPKAVETKTVLVSKAVETKAVLAPKSVGTVVAFAVTKVAAVEQKMQAAKAGQEVVLAAKVVATFGSKAQSLRIVPLVVAATETVQRIVPGELKAV